MNTVRETDKDLREMERKVMAHRYLYYIECDPVITDFQYDQLQREFDKVGNPNSPAVQVGSDLSSDYSADEIELAMYYAR